MRSNDGQPFSRHGNPLYATINHTDHKKDVRLGSRKLNMDSLEDMTVTLPTGVSRLPSTCKQSAKGTVKINPEVFDRDIHLLSPSRQYRTLNIDEGLANVTVGNSTCGE